MDWAFGGARRARGWFRIVLGLLRLRSRRFASVRVLFGRKTKPLPGCALIRDFRRMIPRGGSNVRIFAFEAPVSCERITSSWEGDFMRRPITLAGGILATVFGLQALATPSFTPLGDLAGGNFYSEAHGVSADTSAVVGTSHSASGYQAFRWTEAGGMVGLGGLAPGASSHGYGLSADGSVVVGDASEAFHWTQGGGMVGLGGLPGSTSTSSGRAYGASADGSVLAGSGQSASDGGAWRWTQASGIVELGALPGDSWSGAVGVSHDGGVVVGRSGSEAFRWTESGGMTGLGDLPGGGTFSYAYAASGNGQVVVGLASSSSGSEAFRWTEGGGMVGLGDLPGGSYSSVAYAASLDGSTVVGHANFAGTGVSDAFVWDEENGMRDLQQVLSDYGIDLTGWDLWEAKGVSDDGLTIVGYGANPSGLREGWIATIPEPSTALLLGFGFLGMVARRRVLK